MTQSTLIESITFKNVPNHWLFLALMIVVPLHMIINTPGLLSIVLIVAATAFVWPQYKRLSRRWGWVPNIFLVIVASSLAFAWIGTAIQPAHAQFFGVAEQFFQTTFGTTAGAGTTVTFVFNVLRALFIIYVAVSFIGIVNAVRQDEDWQTAARTPIIIILVVVLADILSTFILQGAGAP
jgi:hypothetical protein